MLRLRQPPLGAHSRVQLTQQMRVAGLRCLPSRTYGPLRKSLQQRRAQSNDDFDMELYEQWQPKERQQLDIDLDSATQMDTNQLQTALSMAIEAEDYELASRVRDMLQAAMAAKTSSSDPAEKVLDWRVLGLPDWLADRAERLGLRFPTEIQQRSSPVILAGCDAILQSETGSGKTGAFLLPALARLDYPPALFPEDLDGPQLLVLVPTFELGVQVALLVYKLLGGNISSRNPGDPANMFSYEGPRGIKVRGLLTEEELLMAASQPRYLSGVHVLVTTPEHAVAALQMQPSPLNLTDVKLIVIDEVDAILKRAPASCMTVLEAALQRLGPEAGVAAAAAAAAEGGGSNAAALGMLKAMLEQAQQQEEEEGRDQGQGEEGEVAGIRGEGEDGGSQAGPGPGPRQPGDASEAAQLLEQQWQRWTQQQQWQQQAQASSSAAADGSREAAAAAAAAGAAPEGASSSSSSSSGAAVAETTDYSGKPQVVVVGATVTDAEIRLAQQAGWLEEPVLVQVGAPCSVPQGLTHKAVLVSQEQYKLAVLVRLLREDLVKAQQQQQLLQAAAADAGGASSQQLGRPPVRVIVFAEDEEGAKAAADPLRTALWNEHMLSVLLPSGAEPIKALHAFRDRAASLLLATSAAGRGLDLPAVSHVYNLEVPADPREYLHRAGRAGRIGSLAGGVVTTLVTPESLPALQAMAQELGVTLQVTEGEASDAGVGLLGEEWVSLTQLFAGAEGEGADKDGMGVESAQGGSSSSSGGGGGGEGVQDKQLEAARRGLEDLYNLF